MKKQEMWNYLMDNMGVSEHTLQVATNLLGYSVETMESVLYAVSGYRSFEQVEEANE